MTNEQTAHYHDCAWGAGGKHVCFNPECAAIADEPPSEGAAFHGHMDPPAAPRSGEAT